MTGPFCGPVYNYCKSRQDVIVQKREHALSFLQSLDHVAVGVRTEGAFYEYLRIHTDLDSFGLCKRLINVHFIAVKPARPFGINNDYCMRISSCALETDRFELAMERSAKGLNEICNH